jgi:hypothetical protein
VHDLVKPLAVGPADRRAGGWAPAAAIIIWTVAWPVSKAARSRRPPSSASGRTSEDGARRPASSILVRSSSLMGRSANSRTLRRLVIASQVSTAQE